MQAGALAILAPAVLMALRLDGETLASVMSRDVQLYAQVLLAAWAPLVALGAWAGWREDVLEREKAELESLAVTDPLTGLKNVRYFRARLAEASSRAQRDGRPVALAVIDLDHFKRINDRHGHPVGDRVLSAVACAVASVCRRGETAARIGGEELAVILPGADREAARVAGERIRRAIAALAIKLGRGKDPLRVTASIGVASTYETGSPSPDALFAAADRALFAAKAAGRDRTEVAPSRGGMARAGVGDAARDGEAAGQQAPGDLYS